MGHAQAAAGVAGVIKMVEALRRGVLPATLHVDAPSSKVDWSSGGVRLLTEARAWPEVDRPRRAGVSSFGVSGTNAHVIVEQAPELPGETPEDVDEIPDRAEQAAVPVPVPVWPVSGRGAGGLRAQAARLAEFAAENRELSAAEIGHALATTRAALDERAVVVAGDRDEAVAALNALATGESVPAVVTGSADVTGKTVFVFPGQGAQWAGMGAELLASSPVFSGRIAECAAALA
ncbi:ketoacyl-synthetase C-terminal extension domain-containing protein, partial [Microbispora sp. NBRC 16548]|uniref:ketoacyl-synthetase C-terminal extension domain-containing protein n=1 Tax=Microbispora sp. NBRC 16548 TaxID=3030994 RepID=UPI002554489A